MQLQVHEDGSVVRTAAAPTTTRRSQRAFQLPANNPLSNSVAFGVLRSYLVDGCSMLSTINTKKVKVAVK
jgi:hypothetical protein